MESKIVLGDCLSVMGDLEAESFEAVITDFPYGIDFQSAWRIDKATWKPKIANDEAPFIWFLPQAFRVLKQGGVLLCFVRYDKENDLRWAMRLAGFTDKAQIIWDKQTHGMGDLKGDFAPAHENIVFATKGRFIFPGKRPKSILRHPRVSPDKLQHPNEKPVSLMRELIEAVTTEGQTVLDPFCGVGPTLIAAKECGRNAVGIELSEEYFRISQARLTSVPPTP